MKEILLLMLLIIFIWFIILGPFIILTVYLQPYGVFGGIMWIIFIIAFIIKMG